MIPNLSIIGNVSNTTGILLLNGENDSWTLKNNVWKKEQDIGPSPRAKSNMVYADGKIALFGGSTSQGLNRDTWEWNGTVWSQRQNMGPDARSSHSMAYDSDRKRIVLFGGSAGSDNNLGDTWELRIETIPE